MRISDWSSDVCSSDLPRFDDPVGDEPDDRGEKDDDAKDEIPVAERVHRPAGLDDARGFLREAEQQDIELTGHDIAGIAPRHGGERGGNSRERVAADRKSTRLNSSH